MKHTHHKVVLVNIIDDALIVTVDRELDDMHLTTIQNVVLNKITTQTLKGVLIDFSGVEILDTYLANKIIDLSEMIKLMGVVPVVVGLRPEVIASLVMLGFTANNLMTALNVGYGIELLRSMLSETDEMNNKKEEDPK